MEKEKITLEWKTEQRRVKDLVPYVGNPRQMTEAEAKALRESIERFNLVEIPVIDLHNTILAGHQRLRIMQLLGREEEIIDVRVPNRELTPEEFVEYNLISNKVHGGWNWDILSGMDTKLLLEVGFKPHELMVNPDGTPEEAKPVAHSIICPYCDKKIKVSNRVRVVEKLA